MNETKPTKQVRVCQHQSCRKLGATQVLEAFELYPVEGVEVIAVHCLGQCGNGPMVLVLPEEVWYCRVSPQEVPAVVERHLIGGNPVKGMLYRKFHPSKR
ncbi:(2Fe-2S) ferredoxin domain-containing protein [Roseofilum sp. BLCC_M154]|uniref:(2Fe-2S) ferredoxin domain-containing protein n=1 Tax=Roseofilum acuticapitatum BLCC-M154 TaxID=3022444 RepID=A0ABT7AVN1_9CYAN|nr:(2Fe-2S) ferredoxin domain-containing protein [Roseofilum acuticapitatum]MDJ1170964.1 (2Fe-2S) ferredoxin domain-containing protein [Roseofilum acuticapitatum BLCC-M154]